MTGPDLIKTDPISTALGAVVRIAGTVSVAPGGNGPATDTFSRVASSAANTNLLAANAARRGGTIYNNAQATGTTMYVLLGSGVVRGAGSDKWTLKIPPEGYFEIPFDYSGNIDCRWDIAGAGDAQVNEYTT